jgi:hypothetical protein
MLALEIEAAEAESKIDGAGAHGSVVLDVVEKVYALVSFNGVEIDGLLEKIAWRRVVVGSLLVLVLVHGVGRLRVVGERSGRVHWWEERRGLVLAVHGLVMGGGVCGFEAGGEGVGELDGFGVLVVVLGGVEFLGEDVLKVHIELGDLALRVGWIVLLLLLLIWIGVLLRILRHGLRGSVGLESISLRSESCGIHAHPYCGFAHSLKGVSTGLCRWTLVDEVSQNRGGCKDRKVDIIQ